MIKFFAKVDSVFTENGVDCLWMVTKYHVKNRVIILVIVNACEHPAEAEMETGFMDGKGRVSKTYHLNKISLNYLDYIWSIFHS